MATNKTSIILTADDRTRAAFASAKANMQGLQQVGTQLRGVLAGIGLGVGASAAGLLSFVSTSIAAADALTDLRDRTGLSIETLNGLTWAAKLGDTNMDALASSVGRLNKSIGEAQAGNETMRRNLAALGITAQDPEQALYQLADAVAAMPEPARRAAELNKILGKSYQEMLPLLAGGGDALRAMTDEGRRLNPITTEMAENAAKFTDQMDAFKLQAAGAGTSIANQLLPAMNELLETFNQANREFSALDSALITLGKLGVIGETLGVLWANLSFVFKGVGTEIGGIGAQIAAIARGDFAQAGFISDAMKKDAAIARQELDELEKRIFGLGEKPAQASQQQKTSLAPVITISDVISPEFEKDFEKALNTKALDRFTAKFADTRSKIEAEYAALQQTFGATAGGATGSDIQGQIVTARSAIAGGDNTTAQAALSSAKDNLKTLSGSGAPAFELNYLASQLKALELQTVNIAEETATQTKTALLQSFGDINTQIAQISKPQLVIDTDLLTRQIETAIADAQQQLTNNPLQIPVIASPQAGTGGLSVNLQRTAVKFGGR